MREDLAPDEAPRGWIFGCRPVHIPRAVIEHCERHNNVTETVVVCDPVSVYYQQPGQVLVGLLRVIAHLGGSLIAPPPPPISCRTTPVAPGDAFWRRTRPCICTLVSRNSKGHDQGGQRHAVGCGDGGILQHHRVIPVGLSEFREVTI